MFFVGFQQLYVEKLLHLSGLDLGGGMVHAMLKLATPVSGWKGMLTETLLDGTYEELETGVGLGCLRGVGLGCSRRVGFESIS